MSNNPFDSPSESKLSPKQKAEDHSIFPRFPHWSLVLWLHGSRKKVTMTSPCQALASPKKKQQGVASAGQGSSGVPKKHITPLALFALSHSNRGFENMWNPTFPLVFLIYKWVKSSMSLFYLVFNLLWAIPSSPKVDLLLLPLLLRRVPWLVAVDPSCHLQLQISEVSGKSSFLSAYRRPWGSLAMKKSGFQGEETRPLFSSFLRINFSIWHMKNGVMNGGFSAWKLDCLSMFWSENSLIHMDL